MLEQMKRREERVAQARRDLRLRPQDELTLIELPKNSRQKGGTMSYKRLSAKANRLQGDAAALKAKIARAETANLPKAERQKKLAGLRCQLAYTKVKLSAEVEASPRVYVSAQVADSA